MAEFKNVTVKKEANVYFDGKVTSFQVTFENGEVKTLGVMAEGEYRFNTNAAEVMEMLSGEFEVKFKDKTEFVKMQTPCEFSVEANSYFDIKITALTNYCCSYIN